MPVNLLTISVDGQEIDTISRPPCYYEGRIYSGQTGYYRHREDHIVEDKPLSGEHRETTEIYEKKWDSLEDTSCDLTTSSSTSGPTISIPSHDFPSYDTNDVVESGIPPADYTKVTTYKVFSFSGVLEYAKVTTQTWSLCYNTIQSELKDEAATLLAALSFDTDGVATTILVSSWTLAGTVPGITVSLKKCRFKWKLPSDFTGAYFKITWDVVEFPVGGSPVVISHDLTWEWIGPGDPMDPSTFESGWYEIPLPSAEGQVRVVNARFISLRSDRFGVAPTPYGESYP